MSNSDYKRLPNSPNSDETHTSDSVKWKWSDVVIVVTCLSFFLIFLIIAVPLGVSLIVLFFFLSTIFGLATSLSLLISLFVTRTLQLIRTGEGYEALSFYKNLIRTWLCIIPSITLVELVIIFLIAKNVPTVKQVTLLDVPLTEWIELIIIICFLCVISSALCCCVMQVFSLNVLNGSKGSNTGQAITEIIDCLVFWCWTNLFMKYVPHIKHHEILGFPTRNWIGVSVVILISYNLLILITRMIVWLLRLAIYQLHPRKKNPAKDPRENKSSPQGTDDEDTGDDWRSKLKKHFHGMHVVYYANGMIVSSCFVMSSLVLLLTWILYFGSHLDMIRYRSIWEFGRWTFISLLVCSVLWLIKTFILLVWEEHTVYKRLQSKIISASDQLYFLGVLSSTDNKHDFLDLKDPGDFGNILSWRFPTTSGFWGSLSKPVSGLFEKIDNFNLYHVRKSLQKSLLIQDLKKPTVDEIQQAAQYFLVARQTLVQENYISDIRKNFPPREFLKKLREKIEGENVQSGVAPNTNQNGSHGEGLSRGEDENTQKSNQNNEAKNNDDVAVNLKEIENAGESFTGNDADKEKQGKSEAIKDENRWTSDFETFREKVVAVKEESCNVENDTNFSVTDFYTWVDRAHSECLSLVNTIISAKKVADCLNRIISWLLIGVVFIMWLLLTGLATTQVLVLIASPLLAASFIFGDTCKALFKGIIYVFVVHPFDVGDLCIIEEKLMEVISIGIWTTTFEKVDTFGSTQELVIHSNSQLRNKTITNYKTKFDWSDRVELNLGPINFNRDQKRALVVNFFTRALKEIEEKEEHLTSDNKGEIDLNPDTTAGNVGINGDNNAKKCLRKKLLISCSPHLTISTMEDKTTLVIHLEYKANKNTKDWPYSKCLRRKDELKGDFNLYMQDAVSKFKEHAEEVASRMLEGWRYDMDKFPYYSELPPYIHDHIEGWKDVIADGNCGFRCVADAFCRGQENWEIVRGDVIDEISKNRNLYDLVCYNDLSQALDRIKWEGGECGEEHYMEAIADLYPIANHFRCTIFFFGITGTNDTSATIRPHHQGLNVHSQQRQQELVIAHLSSRRHFILLQLHHGHPVPPIPNAIPPM